MPSPFDVVVRSATRVCPFGPVETRWLLQPAPEVQLPVRVVVAPLGPVLERVRLTVPVPEVETERGDATRSFPNSSWSYGCVGRYRRSSSG